MVLLKHDLTNYYSAEVSSFVLWRTSLPVFKSANLYNNLAKQFTTVCSDPFYGQTSGPRPPKNFAGILQIKCGISIAKKKLKKKNHEKQD
jgi:hypothetical protein